MATKLTTLTHLRSVSNSVKDFIINLVGYVAQATADAIEELEGRLNQIEDASTGITYTISIEDGRVYLDDGKDLSN